VTATGSPVPAELAPGLSHGRTLVGRTREVAEIARALGDAENGHGRLVLLAGEPGIGKTSVADAATALAEARGFAVLWGRCWESGGAPAYFPWLGVLSAMARELDDETLASVLGDGAPVLGEILPELRRRLPPPSAGANPPPEEARFRVFRAIVALTREAARTRASGLVVVLDDIHAADRSSLLLLHFLARELRGSRLLVLATYRDVEARTDAETRDLVARIGREGTTLTLARLDSQAAAALVSAHASSVTERVCDRILERAQGNPLFLEEMLRLLAEQGPDSIEAGVVPHGVRDVIGRRLSRVSVGTRALLELGAVGGDEIDPVLLRAAAGEDAPRVSAALAEATDAGVLLSRGEKMRFAHALFREVLYRDLSPERRTALHASMALSLERSSATPDALPHDEIAHHALEGPPELLARGVEHAIEAACRAEELLAYDDAVETLERTLAAVASKGNPPALRAAVLVGLGQACIRRGDASAGKRHCREASGIARSLGDVELGARAALTYGRVFTFGKVDAALVEMLESSLEALPAGDSVLRARLLGRLAAALQPAVNVAEPVGVAREAIQTARRLADPRALLEVLHDSISAMMDCTDPAEVLALNLEAEQLAQTLGDRERLLRTHGRLFFVHLSRAELELADARLEAYEALASELAAPWIGFRSRFARALRATMHGRFAEAERFLDEALRLGEAVGDPVVKGLYGTCRESLLRAGERHDDLLSSESIALRMGHDVSFSLTWPVFQAGITRARREEVEQTAAYLRMVPSTRPKNLFALFFMVEMVTVAGTREQAEELLPLVAACPEEYLTLGWSYVSWEGPKSRFLALLYARLGRFDEARADFEDALARLERLETGPFLARTEYEYGRMLAERAAPGDAEKARALFGSARERATRLAMPGLVAHLDRRLSTLGGDAPTVPHERSAALPATRVSAASPPPLALLLEGEYFTVGYRGETFRLKSSLGLTYIARLMETPGREVHVLDLVRERQGASDPSELSDQGDAGELIDESAKESYRRRLDDLRETLAEAESFGDGARADRARAEMELLARELSRAVGLGGRARKAGVAAERARSAVQRRIRHAIERVRGHSPGLADFFERSVNTGIYCSYIPVPD